MRYPKTILVSHFSIQTNTRTDPNNNVTRNTKTKARESYRKLTSFTLENTQNYANVGSPSCLHAKTNFSPSITVEIELEII